MSRDKLSESAFEDTNHACIWINKIPQSVGYIQSSLAYEELATVNQT
jgi:hypothetical protein